MDILSILLGNILLYGIIISAIYILIAVGFTIIYSVGRTINLSHASYLMIAGYTYWSLAEGGPYFSLPKALAFFIAILVAIIASVATYLGIVRRFLRKGDNISICIATLILALLIEAILTQIFSAAPRTILPIIEGDIEILGTKITFDRLLMITLSWMTIFTFFVFINRTQLGRALRAISIDEKGGILVGINPEKIRLVTWILAGALAGIGGILYAKFTLLNVYMWIFPLITSFAVVVIGGLGSIIGALVAAHIIGFTEAITVVLIDPRLRGIIGFILMILVLVFRPKGLFGKE